MNASVIHVHIFVKIPSEASAVVALMGISYQMVACHALQLMVRSCYVSC